MASITGSTTIDWSGVSLDPINVQQDFNNFAQRFNNAVSEIQLGHYSLNVPPSPTSLSVTLDSGGIITATGTGLNQTNPVVTSFEYSNPSTGDVVSLAGTIDFVGKEVVNQLTIGFPGVQQTIIGNISVDLSSGNASGSITQLQETLGTTEVTLKGSLVLSGNFDVSGTVTDISVVDGTNTIVMNGLLLPYSALGSVTTANDLFSVVGNLMSGNDTITYTNNSGVGMTFFGGAGNDTITINGPNANTLNGGAGNDIITGGGGNDTLNGGLGADSMSGGLGNDTYVVDNVGDSVTENLNEGTDLVQSSVSYTLGDNVENLTLTGAGAITGTGNALNNSLTGNGAANVLDGQGGADQMAGGLGNDTYVVDNAGDTVTENLNSGIDLVKSSVNFTLGDNVENLTLTGLANLTGTGNAGNNVLSGNAGNNVLDGQAGNDNMAGGVGDDTYVVDAAGDVVTEALNAGTDTVQSSINYTLGANLENLTLTGSANLNGTGNALNNSITGNSGNNMLSGGAGQDTVVGGLGDDQITMLVTAGNVDTIDAGDGTDTLVLSGVVPGNHEVVVDLSSATDQVVSIGGVADDVQKQINFENLNAAGIGSFVTVTGSAGANNIIGSNGNDTITGGGGNDTLNGGLGADSMSGGLGNDTYVVDNVGDSVTENLNEGTDLVQSSVSYTLGDNVENLTLTGAGAITGTGNALNNSLTGNGAANVLDGQGGADQMAGGLGNDTYVVDNAGDTVTENLNSGIDLVKSSVNFTLGDNVENLTLTGLANLTGTGNAGNNVLSGNAGNNVLDGQAGNDNMAGGVGDDTYVVDAAGDVVTEALNAGTDTVQSSINYTLGANLENLTLTGSANLNGTGNALNNSITGNSGNNMLSGGAGQDTVVGGLGDDQITMLVTAGNVDTIDAGDGTDTLVLSGVVPGNHEVVVDLSSATDQVVSIGGVADDVQKQINFENLNAAGIGSFVTVTGSAGANNIIGSNGNDTITGGGGNDTLNGGLGADSMSGGLGNDTYVVDNVGDSVTENLNEGTDLVQSSVSYTLGDNVENLTLTGAGAITGTGNALNNSLTGNGAANVLDGQGGADQMAGGLGNDTYVVDNAGDTVTENLNSGIDLVKSSVNFTLGDNVENLTLTGLANLTGTGNAGNNVLSGNAGNNVLDGQAGNDNMAGGVGDDTYVVDAAGDVVTEALNAGTDTVQSSINYTLGANLENLTLTGSANLNGTGNALNNSITGNSGNNMLSGGAGQDTVVGGLGDDQITMLVTAGNVDTIDAGDGTDTLVLSGVVPGNHEVVVDLSSATDQVVSIGGVADDVQKQINFENLNAAGIGSFVTVTGSAGANNIIGSNGNDTITGGGGNDTLNGGLGADSMSGGLGNDTYVVDNVGDSVTENLNEGTDLVQSSVSYTLGDNVENLTLTGAGAITGTGNALNNSLTGNGAANVLDGQGGADQMAGGLGNDTYVVDNAGDTVTENLNSGIDLVKSSVNFTLGDNVENLTLTGLANLTGTGNAGNNVLSGNAGNNVLDGQAGNDNMAGGVGDDTYVVDAAGDVVTEALNAGTDTVQSSINYTLGANLENLTLTGSANLNGTGNALNNSITGNSGNNMLSGGAGQDTVVGGLGDDQITMLVTAGNVDTIDAGDGTDTLVLSGVVPGNHEVVVDLSSATDQVVSIGGVADDVQKQINFENLNAAGIGSFVTVTGSAGANNIIGSNGNDTLIGGDGNDTLSGLAGNDTLEGGDGNDTLIGGTGNDTFDFGLGGGQDLIQDSSGSADKVSFDSGINPLDLVISRQANDLRLAIHGSPDQITVQNWYVGTTNRTETIQAGNNQVLLSTQVDQLVQAMAQFTTDTGVSWDNAIAGSGTAQQQTQFQGIIAASWQ